MFKMVLFKVIQSLYRVVVTWRFALTANYLKNDALIENTNSDRLNIRANTSVSLLDNLSVNMDFNSYRTNREEPLTGY